MINEKTAIIVATGKEVKVYKHRDRGTWVDSSDLETEYKPKQLRFK